MRHRRGAGYLLPLLLTGVAACVLAPASFAHGHVSVSIGWPGYVGWWYPPYYYGPYYGPYYPAPEYVPSQAAIDTDIHPEQAEVWLDGSYIGIADQFDGFPRYLVVPTGHHQIEFRLKGYRPLVVDVTARPGRLYGLDRWLREGASEAPPLPPPQAEPEPAPPETPREPGRNEY